MAISSVVQPPGAFAFAKPRRMLKSRRNRLILSGLLLAGVGTFLGFRQYNAGITVDPSGLDLATVSRGDLEIHFNDAGEIKPKSYTDITSKVSGRVIKLLVEEGSYVAKGVRLAVIQPGRSEIERYVPFTVTSPLAGVVMRYQKEGDFQQEEGRIVRLGDYVTGLIDSNAPTYLMTVADMTRLIVKMKISEMDVLKLKEGMNVKVTLDAIPNETFPAQVSLISPQAEKDKNDIKTFKVEVALLKNDPRFKPGMTARVDGLLDIRKNVVKVPLSGVFEESGKQFAYVYKTGGKPKRTELKLGLRNDMETEVLDGVTAGQRVLTEKPVN